MSALNVVPKNTKIISGSMIKHHRLKTGCKLLSVSIGHYDDTHHEPLSPIYYTAYTTISIPLIFLVVLDHCGQYYIIIINCCFMTILDPQDFCINVMKYQDLSSINSQDYPKTNIAMCKFYFEAAST